MHKLPAFGVRLVWVWCAFSLGLSKRNYKRIMVMLPIIYQAVFKH
jgi:hypothetical protein